MAYFYSAGNSNNLQKAFLYLAFFVALSLFLWFELKLLLLAFAGILFAIVLEAVTSWILHKTRLNFMLSYLATILLLTAVIVGAGLLLIPTAAAQLMQMARDLPQSIHQVEEPLTRTPWGQQIIAEGHRLLFGPEVAGKLTYFAHAVSTAIAALFIIVVIGVFAALNPRGYQEGLLILLPPPKRPFWEHVGKELHHQLKWWLTGQLLMMVAMGTICGLCLWLLGVQLAWTLGVLTGLAVFFPYVGTVAAGIPSVLMALQRGPRTALYVLIVFTALHAIEGYILGPLVQRKIVHLPPVLTILSQFFMWSVAGILGVALAAPLATAGLVVLKIVYLQVPADEKIVVKDENLLSKGE